MKRLLATLALICLLPPTAGAAELGSDRDWPCQQRLVPTITPAMVWTGPSLEGIGNWRAEPAVAALVERIMPRSVPTEEGEAAIAQFAHGLGGDRKRLLTLVFAGLLDDTNQRRSEVIERIKLLAERQRNLADLIARLTTELDATPEGAAGRDDLVERWTFTTRTYKEVQRTMRYACDVPVQLDARLGAYARALEAALA
jgi:hypothetical protein